MRDIDEVSGDVIDVALRIHRELGPGLLESVYETVLSGKLEEMGYVVDRQRPIDIEFEGTRFTGAFRADLIVEKTVIVELKSQEKIPPVDYKILLTQLKLSKLPVALMINFYEILLKNGIRRFVN